MVSFNNIDDSAYHRYSGEIQALYVEIQDCERSLDDEKADSIRHGVKEKIIDALLDWNLGRSDLHALGRLLNLCENREPPPEDEPEIQYLP
jgi:hypothetical protein